MNRYSYNIVYHTILLILLSLCSFAQPNPTIINYQNSINQDSLKANVHFLENFQSRYAFHPNRKQIALSLQERLQAYGWEAQIDSFYIENFEFPKNSGIINNSWQYNVVAQKIGSFLPDSIFILGAHYDCYANFDTLTFFENSPGADDNASGVSAILEIARIYQKHNILPLKTLRLELYAAEETGLHGSLYAAEQTLIHYENILAMLCLDMIGYKIDSLMPSEVKIISYDNSEDLTALCQEISLTYTDLIPNITTQKNNASDSYSYYLMGKKALFLHEQDFHPFYHSSGDKTETLNFSYLKEITSLAFYLTHRMTDTAANPLISNPRLALAQNLFQISENPVKDKIRFTFQGSTPDQFQLFLTDEQGRLVLQSPISEYRTDQKAYQVPVHSLPSGVYVLSLRSSANISTHKIIIL